LTRALHLSKEPYKGIFSDVPKSLNWAAIEIEAANRAGIIQGNDGKFNPNDPITREQMAAMVVRAIEYKDKNVVEGKGINPRSFADEHQISTYAKRYVLIANELGIINGKVVNDKTIFAPKEKATRAQAAKMLYQLLTTLREL
jgi:hypothetical protein